eukprot:6381811-Pyramimonas_sp.AAC.1
MTRRDALAAATVASADQWGETQAKAEEKFRVKQLKSKAEASLGDNVLLDHEAAEPNLGELAAE